MSVRAGGDQHGGLAVGGQAEAHGRDPGLVRRRDGRVEHKAAGDACYRVVIRRKNTKLLFVL